jgi:Flp pilus assembly pilin Flp
MTTCTFCQEQDPDQVGLCDGCYLPVCVECSVVAMYAAGDDGPPIRVLCPTCLDLSEQPTGPVKTVERGQGVIEYALIIGLVVLVLITTYALFGKELASLVSSVSGTL